MVGLVSLEFPLPLEVAEGESGNVAEYDGCNGQPENVNIHDVKQASHFAVSYTQSKSNLTCTGKEISNEIRDNHYRNRKDKIHARGNVCRDDDQPDGIREMRIYALCVFLGMDYHACDVYTL